MAERLAPEKRYSFIHGGEKVFEWDQTLEEVNVYIPLPPGNVPSKLFYCKIQSQHIVVGIRGNDHPYLDHDLAAPVKTDSSFWTLEDGTMHVTLQKRDKGLTWPSPIQGQGMLDPHSADLEQKRLMLQRFQEETPDTTHLSVIGTSSAHLQLEAMDSTTPITGSPDYIDVDSTTSLEDLVTEAVPLAIEWPSTQPLRLEPIPDARMPQIADQTNTDLPPLDIDWPSSLPALEHEPDMMSSLFFSQLHELLLRRPLLSPEAARVDLGACTAAYHVLGYAKEPWMIALQTVWMGLVHLHLEEQRHHWESEILPRLHGLHLEVDVLKGEATSLSSEASEVESLLAAAG